jgi:phosphatidylglycerophosphatase A
MLRLATVFGLGHLRPAPGTWASLVALIAGMLLFKLSFWALLAATGLAVALGFVACRSALRPGEDPSEVVIDEVAGQWIALLFPAAGFAFSENGAAFIAAAGWMPWPAWVAPFLLFRLFDIWKPGLVGRADAKGTAAGVMEDDLWAGLFAGIATVVLAVAYHLPMVLR